MRRISINNRTVNPDRFRYFYIRELTRQTTPFTGLKALRPNYLHRIGVIVFEHTREGNVAAAVSLCSKADKFDPKFAVSLAKSKLEHTRGGTERSAVSMPMESLKHHTFYSLLGLLSFDNQLIDERLANVPTTMHNRAIRRIAEDFELQKEAATRLPTVLKPILLVAPATKPAMKPLLKKAVVRKKTKTRSTKSKKIAVRSRK